MKKLIMVVGVFWVTISTVTAQYNYEGEWGSYGSAPGSFNFPKDAAVYTTPYGDIAKIYVTDMSNHRVQYFTPLGSLLGYWGSYGAGNGEFNNPEGIDVTPDGSRVYVVDKYNNRVQYFTSTGSFLGKWGSEGSGDYKFQMPWAIAVNPATGHVYVTDRDNTYHVKYYTSNGSFVGKWGVDGTGDGEIKGPMGIACADSGNVYVACAARVGNPTWPGYYLMRIQYFTPSGSFLGKWGSYGSGYGQFNWIHHCDISDDNRFYVADENNAAVQYFTLSGGFLGQFGTPGTGPGQLCVPQGCAFQYGGRVYVVDTGNDRIQYFIDQTSHPDAGSINPYANILPESLGKIKAVYY